MSNPNTIVDIIKDSLYDALKLIFIEEGYPNTHIVFANETGLEPKNTYCVIHILQRTRYGRTDESTHLDENNNLWRTEHFKLSLQLSFIGTNSESLAWDFDDVFPASRKYLEEFQKRNLGYLLKSTLRRAPQPRETKWVDGWNLDLDLSFAIQSCQEMYWIKYVTIDGEVYQVYPDVENRTVENEVLRTVENGEVRDLFVL